MNVSKMMQIKRLTDECVQCACTLTGLIIGEPQNITESKLRSHAIESFGFIMAFLYYSDGLSLDEVGNCNACFISSAFGNNRELYYKTAETTALLYSHIFQI